MTALDKVLALAGGEAPAPPAEDAAGQLVKAAVAALGGVRLYLAGGDDDDDKGKGSDDHSSHATFKALKKKGMDDAKAKSLCAQADKRVKAAAALDAALIALGRLAVPDGDWVAATSRDTWTLAARGNGKSLPFADPGFRGGTQRFPVDTAESTQLSLTYLVQAGQAGRYTRDELAVVRSKAAAAAREFGLTVAADDERAAVAALLELSVLTAEERRKPAAHTMGDSDDFPIPDKAHLSAAVGRYKQGKLAGHSKEEVAAHIRSRAKALGETVDLAFGSGLEEAAAAVLMLARRAAKGPPDGGVPMDHAPFTGRHSHSHTKSDAHDHDHQHFGDNDHGRGPAHRQDDDS